MNDAVLVARGERAEHAADHRRRGGLGEGRPALADAAHAVGFPFLVVVLGDTDGVVFVFGGVRDGCAGEQVAAVAEVYEEVDARLVLEAVVQGDDVERRAEGEVQGDLVANLPLPDAHGLARGGLTGEALGSRLGDGLERELAPVGLARRHSHHAHRTPAEGLAEDERLVRVASKTEAEGLARPDPLSTVDW